MTAGSPALQMRRSRKSSLKMGRPQLGVMFSSLCLKVGTAE